MTLEAREDLKTMAKEPLQTPTEEPEYIPDPAKDTNRKAPNVGGSYKRGRDGKMYRVDKYGDRIWNRGDKVHRRPTEVEPKEWNKADDELKDILFDV